MKAYSKDILEGFEQRSLNFSDDYEGKVVAILIRKFCKNPTDKAVLYIHGFNDYFFQSEMAEKFNQNDFDFYALDLRKYGRSWLPHQKFNNVRSLNEYNAEITRAIEIIIDEKHDKVTLIGHSTGGLILTNYCANHHFPQLSALILNSPFYDFNLKRLKKHLAIPLGAYLGKLNPNTPVSGGFNELYGKGLHKSALGEWDYRLDWKPHIPPKVNLGFINAIFTAQQKIKKGITIKIPVLLLHSNRSTNPKDMSEDVYTSDIILNVKHIHQGGKNIHGNITEIAVQEGMHDLALSRKLPREKFYQEVFKFL